MSVPLDLAQALQERIPFPGPGGAGAYTVAALAKTNDLQREKRTAIVTPNPVTLADLARIDVRDTFVGGQIVMGAVFDQLPLGEQSHLGHLLRAHREATRVDRVNSALDTLATSLNDAYLTVFQARNSTLEQGARADRIAYLRWEGQSDWVSDIGVRLAEVAAGFARGNTDTPVMMIAGVRVAVEPGLAARNLTLTPLPSQVPVHPETDPDYMTALALSVEVGRDDLHERVNAHFEQVAQQIGKYGGAQTDDSLRLSRAYRAIETVERELRGSRLADSVSGRRAEAVFDRYCSDLSTMLAQSDGRAVPAASRHDDPSRAIAALNHKAATSHHGYLAEPSAGRFASMVTDSLALIKTWSAWAQQFPSGRSPNGPVRNQARQETLRLAAAGENQPGPLPPHAAL